MERFKSGGNWKIALADMMTVLMAFFLVMWIGSIVPDDQRKRFINAMFNQEPIGDDQGNSPIPLQKGMLPHEETNSILLEKTALVNLLQRLAKLDKRIEIVEGKDSILIHLKNDILFESGRAIPKRGAVETVRKIGDILAQSPWPIKVIGHTDNVPINTIQFPSNWDLSAARAATVTRILERSGVAHERLIVLGASDTMPLVENTSPALRAINRRVDILVLTNEHSGTHRARFPHPTVKPE